MPLPAQAGDANSGGCSFEESVVKYTKPWLSYDEQADYLKSQGLEFERDFLIAHLVDVGYYRLSGYWYIFKYQSKQSEDGKRDEYFEKGTSFERVWDLYVFDRQLRLLVLDAIERVEIYMHTQLAYLLAEKSGPFGFLDKAALPNMNQQTYGRFISRCFSAHDRSRTLYIKHFKDKYGDAHGLPPYWTLVNIMDFGMMLTLFKGSPDKVKSSIAQALEIPGTVLESWLLMLNTVRNICAHHDRLWNRRLGNKPKIPRAHKYPDWHVPYEVSNSTTFGLLTILSYLLERIAPDTSWHGKVVRLLHGRSGEDLQYMGFMDGWQECPLWKPCLVDGRLAELESHAGILTQVKQGHSERHC